MKNSTARCVVAGPICLGLFLAQSAAHAEEAPPGDKLEEIVVEAQKRAQSATDVGLSITTVGAETLARRRVDDPFEVAKLVPALSVSRVGTSATTVYTLRGIGFNSAFLGASPTVAVYVDEVPLSYPAMTQGAVMDLERLEVYKGPQGIYFGQNSTAGAINFIAAKPTKTFESGVSAGYGRFDWWDASGFVSGPIHEGIDARLAVRHEGGGPWQKSYTRDDTLGRRDRSSMRFLADMEASPWLRFVFGLNGWLDKSDSQALQLVKVVPKDPKYLLPVLRDYPLPPHDARYADWDIGKHFRYDTKFWQPSLRAEISLSDAVTLTSITAYARYQTDSLIDNDGTILQINEHRYYGTIRTFNQELRLLGTFGRLTGSIGANYADDRVRNGINQFTYHSSFTQNVAGTGFSIGQAPVLIEQNTRTKAVFANVEYRVTDTLSVIGGARYTDPTIKFRGCNRGPGTPPMPNTPTPGVTQDLEGLFNLLYQVFSGNKGVNPIQRGGCITLNSLDKSFLPTDSPQTLAESNVSKNITVNYKPTRDVLLYGLVSQGFKSGSFPIFGAATNEQYLPAHQEEVRAYESGFKLTLLNRSLQLDGAAFYYDYHNKQLSGFLLDRIFGPLEALVNIPKSDVKGAEIALAWVPFSGLTLNVGGTYIKTRIKEFKGFDSTGVVRDFAHDSFNLSPSTFLNLDATYRWAVGSNLEASVGAGLVYRSSTSATIGDQTGNFKIPSYGLLDTALGLEQRGQGWSASLWGKNITNKFYTNNISYTADNITRVVGLPRTYGVTVGYRFRPE